MHRVLVSFEMNWMQSMSDHRKTISIIFKSVVMAILSCISVRFKLMTSLYPPHYCNISVFIARRGGGMRNEYIYVKKRKRRRKKKEFRLKIGKILKFGERRKKNLAMANNELDLNFQFFPILISTFHVSFSN